MENINLTSLSRGNQWNGSALGERENRDKVEGVIASVTEVSMFSFHGQGLIFMAWTGFGLATL